MIHFEETTVIHAPIERVFDLSRNVEVHLLANIHGNEQAQATGGITTGLVGLGDKVTWRAKHFGFWHDLTSETTALEAPTWFQVTMVRGIFRSMQADHRLRLIADDTTELKDDFRIEAPLPLFGRMAELLFLRRYMMQLNRERNIVIKQLAESDGWRRYLEAL